MGGTKRPSPWSPSAVQSTVYGARPHLGYGYHYGKRSADADADAYYGYGHGLAYAGEYSYGLPGHSYTAVSRVHGLGHYGKRSADADADGYYGYGYGHGLGYGYGHGVGIHNNNVYSGFTGNHYATALPGHSFAAVTRGKREAEADAEADAYYGYYGRGYGSGT